MLGAQGTTGTQASFLEIFAGDGAKCDRLNELICKNLGFSGCYDVSTQTYTRKVDLIVANAICGLGATAQKITGDIRHLASWKEVEESVLLFPTSVWSTLGRVAPAAPIFSYPPGLHLRVYKESLRLYLLLGELLTKDDLGPSKLTRSVHQPWYVSCY